MARPRNKEDLIVASNNNYNLLFDVINSMSEEEQQLMFLFEDRDKTVKDVLIHLYEWHQLLLDWVAKNQSGIKSSFLPEPYNWRTYPDMNVFVILAKHVNTSFTTSVKLLNDSHQVVMSLIEGLSNEILFTKGILSWTGGTTLGSYCVSATASHYDWATKKLKRQVKLLRS